MTDRVKEYYDNKFKELYKLKLYGGEFVVDGKSGVVYFWWRAVAWPPATVEEHGRYLLLKSLHPDK